MTAWISFHIFILFMLVIDLYGFNKTAHEVKLKEATIWSIVWISIALCFCGGVYYFMGQTASQEFLAAYVIEKALSVDNLFVFLSIFTVFSIPAKYQHKILFWGIIGALFMRALFILSGIALVQRFEWIMYFFGAFLIFTGWGLLFSKEKEHDPKNHWLIKIARKYLPFTDTLHGSKFWVLEAGRMVGTPLLLILILVEGSDLLFAVDSIPAVLAITKDPYIAYTSNIFAILGLRSLYFALAGFMKLFKYLKYGLSVILMFVGLKMCVAHYYHFSIGMSLGIIISILTASILLSYIRHEKRMA